MEGAGKSGASGNCGWDVLYESRTYFQFKKGKEKKVEFYLFIKKKLCYRQANRWK